MQKELRIDISKMRYDQHFFEKSAPMVAKAIKSMNQLEAGAVANPDENWMVGHYWLRAPELAPNNEIRSEIHNSISKIKDFSGRIIRGEIKSSAGKGFKNILLIGIGGSALGNVFLHDSLKTGSEQLKLYFFDNTDPDGFEKVLAEISDLSETLGIVISKSGSTIEPRNGQLYFIEALRKAGLNASKHLVAVTKENSKLHKTAIADGWIDTLPMWDWVGGRTSIWCAVGLLPMALEERNIDVFLRGAAEMDQLTRNEDVSKNPAMQLALMWYHGGSGKGLKNMVVLPYRDRLLFFSRYLQQLVMESLGKEKDLEGNIVHQGLTVYGNKGSTDQHAYVQQLRDGINNFFVVFIRTLRGLVPDNKTNLKNLISNFEVEPQITSEDYLHAYYLGTKKALSESQRENMTITIADVSEHSLGQLIALFERAVGYYAYFININAYNQPGVEAGKKAASEIIEIQKELLALIKGRTGSGQSVQELRAGLSSSHSWVDEVLLEEILEPFVARNEIKKLSDGSTAGRYSV